MFGSIYPQTPLTAVSQSLFRTILQRKLSNFLKIYKLFFALIGHHMVIYISAMLRLPKINNY